jgi:hypothetical protein
MTLRRAAVSGLLMLMSAAYVGAQSDNRLALGANFSARRLTDESASGHSGIGLLWRFGEGETGWGWHWALNWFDADVRQSVGGSTVQLGELHIRPIMVGYGYSYRLGRQLFTANLVGGYCFTSMSLAPAAADAYHDRLGARSVSLRTSNPLVVRPAFDAWHDLSEKVGLNASIGFLVVRPRVTVLSTLGEDERRLRADTLQLKIGLVYSIF